MLVSILLMIAIVALMIGINALYVAGEFSAVSARKARLVQLAEADNRLAKTLLPIVEDHHRLDNYIAASQVGITLSSVILGIYGQQQIAPLLAPVLANLPFIDSEIAAAGVSGFLVLILLSTLQVVLGELVPKSLALQYPEGVALATVIPMRWSAELILKPLIILLNGSGSLILRLLGTNHEGGHRHVHSPEEIQFLIRQSHAGGLLDPEEKALLDNAFRAGDLTVADILVPRTRMIAAPKTKPVTELLKLATTSEYSRIPIYDQDIDHLVGLVHIKDLFRLYHSGETADASKILRKASFVPETAEINEAWEIMNQEQTYVAFVFDEYGGTVGMVTREDLIEEFFGEVQDEFDDDEIPPIIKLSDYEYAVRGDVAIVSLNNDLNIELPHDNAHTMSGLILDKIERIPQVGDSVEIDGIQLRVEAVQSKMVERLTLILPKTAHTPEDAG